MLKFLFASTYKDYFLIDLLPGDSTQNLNQALGAAMAGAILPPLCWFSQDLPQLQRYPEQRFPSGSSRL